MQNFPQRQGLDRFLVLGGATILGLFIAYYLGRLSGEGQIKQIAMVFGMIFAMVFVLFIGKNYWLLIPLTTAWSGGIGVLPLPFSVAELGMIMGVGLYIVYLVFKRASFGYPKDFLDLFSAFMLVYVFTVFLRNPVGIYAFASEQVGGRPFFIIAISGMAGIVLCHVRLTPKQARFFPVWLGLSTMAASGLVLITMIFPFLGKVIYPFYNAVDYSEIVGGPAALDTDMVRLGPASNVGLEMIRLMASYVSPASFLFGNIWLILLSITAFIGVAASGFRNAAVTLFAYIGLAAILWKRFAQALVLGIICICTVFALAALNASGFPIHPSLQRSLAWIPAGWDERVIADTKGTTDWRIDMWKQALERKDVIDNQLLGDGFGFDAKELNAVMVGMMQGTNPGIDFFLIRGSFHSGPLSAVRNVGWVGLGIFLTLQIGVAVYSWNVIGETRGSSYFPLAMFIGIVAIFDPFRFVVIFGDFSQDLPRTLLTAGMIKLTALSFRAWKKNSEVQKEPLGYSLATSIHTAQNAIT